VTAGPNRAAGQPSGRVAAPHADESHIDKGWREFREEILARSEQDPAAAAEWLLKLPQQRGDRAFAIRAVMYRWATEDAAAALRWALALQPDSGRECALRAVFAAWSETDPVAAAQALANVGNFRTRSIVTGVLALRWAAKDMRKAIEWVWGLPEGPERRAALTGIVAVLYPKNPSGVRSANSLPEGYDSRIAAQSLSNVMAAVKNSTAARRAPGFSGGLAPDIAFEFRMTEWAKKDPAAAAAWANLMPDAWLRGVALAAVAEALAHSDPRAGEALALGIPDAEKQADTVWTITFRWAQRDPKAAEDWASSTEASTVSEKAMEAIKATTTATSTAEISTSTESDSSTKTSASNATEPVEPTVNADTFSLSWTELVPLVEQLPDSALREGLLHKAAVDWSLEDPVAATSWVMEQMPPGRAADATLRVVVWNWTTRDANAATAWANALTDSYYREQELATVAMALVKTDPLAATAVAETLPRGETRSNVISNLVYQWGLINPEAAQAWGKKASE
jgi:hypothetical protein